MRTRRLAFVAMWLGMVANVAALWYAHRLGFDPLTLLLMDLLSVIAVSGTVLVTALYVVTGWWRNDGW